MPRIELPQNNWAELREPEEVSERGRRPIMSALMRLTPEGWEAIKQLDPEQVKQAVGNETPDPETAAKVAAISATDLEALQAGNDACIVALVREWSFPQAVSLDGALDLPSVVYDRLRDECAPAIKTLFVNFAPKIEEGKVDPSSPFEPSSESNGHLKAETSTIEIPSPLSSEPISSSS